MLFHKSAIFGILIFLLNSKIRLRTIVFQAVIFGILVISIFYLYYDFFMSKWLSYITDNTFHSSGAFVRMGLNVLAGIALLTFSNSWKTKYNDYRLWKSFAIISFVMFIMLIIFNISTFLDRFGLYLIPLQIIVFSRIIYLIKDKSLRYIYFFTLALLYFFVMTIWLLFAVHRNAWIPYYNILGFAL